MLFISRAAAVDLKDAEHILSHTSPHYRDFSSGILGIVASLICLSMPGSRLGLDQGIVYLRSRMRVLAVAAFLVATDTYIRRPTFENMIATGAAFVHCG
jgi:hypothetical protein